MRVKDYLLSVVNGDNQEHSQFAYRVLNRYKETVEKYGDIDVGVMFAESEAASLSLGLTTLETVEGKVVITNKVNPDAPGYDSEFVDLYKHCPVHSVPSWVGASFSDLLGGVEVTSPKTISISGLKPGRYCLRQDAVVEYSKRPAGTAPVIQVKGRVVTKGSHLLAAAKLRGDTTVKAVGRIAPDLIAA
jgi:hypothetical protein